MATSAPTCRSVAAAMPKVSVGTLPTAKGANKPFSAAPATRSGRKGEITRMVPSNLMIDLGGARRREGVRNRQAPRLLLAGCHGNETVHFGTGNPPS
jgi:hypothetical protein